jgi:hypothetical protein
LLPSEEFQQQVYLNVTKGLYSVSMIEFYRSGRYEQDPQKNMAWIRCRGSSILNFDCYSIWQIMFIKYKKEDKDAETTSSLKIQHFPTTFSSRFKVHLSTWYSCDAKTSSLLDDSMNYRRKIISLDIPSVNDNLKINLQAFEFSNNEKTTYGCIRWIPKLIANNGDNDKKIVPVDNYQSIANIQVVPLTTKYSKEVLKTKRADQQQAVNLTHQEYDDDDSGLQVAMATGTGNDDEGDDDDVEYLHEKNQVG